MKRFKEWIAEAKGHMPQTSSANYPMKPIRKPEDLNAASKGDNFETVHFDAIRHNAKLDADHVQAHGTDKEKSDNEKMQRAGEIHLKHLFEPSHPEHKLEKIYFDRMHPDQQKHVLKQHKEKQMQDWKERNGSN